MLESATSKMLSEEHAIIILYNLLCALNHIHSANIMHRDIKSSNLLIDDKCNIRICDFGLARNIPSKEKNYNLEKLQSRLYELENLERAIAKQDISVELKSCMDSKKGSKRTLSPNICTRTHRAPEVIAADNFYNEKLDIWSLGIVLAEVMLQVQSNLNK